MTNDYRTVRIDEAPLDKPASAERLKCVILDGKSAAQILKTLLGDCVWA